MDKLNILIIDKSRFYKDMLVRAVDSTGLGVVTQFAPDELTAMEKLKNSSIDVVLYDIQKEKESSFLIKKSYPEVSLILMLPDKEESKRPNLAGGQDFIIKPGPHNPEIGEESIRKQLLGLFTMIITGRYTNDGGNGLGGKKSPQVIVEEPVKTFVKKVPAYIDLIVIASSTGGPSALETVLKKLPGSLDRPVLVVQHMPGELTGRMARSLDKKCPLTVKEAGEGCRMIPGTVLIAPGGYHMTVGPGKSRSLEIKLDSSNPVNGVRPSADVLFESIARHCSGKGILAVILTGMGSDGMRGVSEVKKHCECYCITQSEKTCVVYGMPKSVVNAGLSDAVADLESVPLSMMNIISGRGNL
ncbi:MAG: hypothetical protein JL50_15060 [Peptococcaceae bacterium BICA1-7]|nr:MAG: hypothetical protein JL50_15060 [Peptococcaceae bacterium BICA1-7]HBV96895.1 chemotaxis response regulator protein-glutamate methylesterase [Desulfotomaculum sp.]